MATVQGDFSIEALLQSFLDGQISEKEFCEAFEEWWNFVADKESYTGAMRTNFENLFQVVSLFTPLEEDRKIYAGYTSATKVAEAVRLSYTAFLKERNS